MDVFKGALAAVLIQSNLKLLCQFCKTYQSEKSKTENLVYNYHYKKIKKLNKIGGSKTRTHDLSVCSQTPYP